MATAKKTTTKSASKVPKAPKVKTLEELHAKLAAKQQDLIDTKRSHQAGELVNPRVLGATRKEIARLMTAIRASQMNEQKESN